MAVDQALTLVGHWIAWVFDFMLAVFGTLEGLLRGLMDQMHLAGGIQTIVLLFVTVMLIVAAIRLFGGLLRLLVMLFLLLLLIHVFMTGPV